jgi:twinkle protein
MPCGNCGSSDGNSLYSDGHTFCFVCQHRTPGDNDVIHSEQMSQNIHLTGSAERLVKRNISEKTNQFYQIYRDGDTLRFPYHDESGILKGVKIKQKRKDFRYEGVSTNTLFAQHRFPNTGKRLVITEGELDAASCYEVMSGWPMVSLPHGAASAKKDCQKQIPFFQGYEEVVVFFDSDPAGRKAAEEVASIIPPGKAKIAKLDQYKDASEALQANDSDAIRKAIWDAKPYRPDGIIDGKTLFEIVTTPQAPHDHEYPFKGLNEKLHGIRYGELTTFCAGSGSGKTSIMRHIATDLLNKNEHVGILELEASNRRTALGLMSTAVGKNLQLGEYGEEELRAAFGDSIATWNLFCFDGFGSYDPDLIYNRIEYMATGLDCKVVFLDHLSILLSGLEGDERRMIDTTMTRLRSLVERTGIALFLVSHLRRAGNDKHSHEEGGRVSLSSLRGSHSIAQISDQVVALEVDQQADPSRKLTTVRVLKNRYSGEVGVACQLSYDLNTCRFIEHEATSDPKFNPATDF